MLTPVCPARDRFGYWTHPDLPDVEMMDSDFVRYCFNLGYHLRIVRFSDSNLLSVDDAAKLEGDFDCSEWMPSPPASSFLVAIRQSHSGPIAVFAIRK